MGNHREKKVAWFATYLGPPFNEAWRKEVHYFSTAFRHRVITCGDVTWPVEVRGNYLLLRHGVRRITLLRALSHGVLVALCALLQYWYDAIHVEAPPHSFWFRIVNPKKVIHQIRSRHWASLCTSHYCRVAPRFQAIIAPDTRTKAMLVAAVGPLKNIAVVPPGVDLVAYRERPSLPWPGNDGFHILFASFSREGGDVGTLFAERGIDILLAAIQNCLHQRRVSLCMVCRNADLVGGLQRYIQREGLGENVTVTNGDVLMPTIYSHVHCTVLPVTKLTSIPDYPYSMIESLACGRPVLISALLPMSEVIEREGGGVAFTPTVEGLTNAIERVMDDYATFQKRARAVAEEHFDIGTKKDFLDALYRSL